MSSRPLVIERVTASSVPSSIAHASRTSASAVTLDVGMMGWPSSLRGSAMKKSGKDSRPPQFLRISSSHCERPHQGGNHTVDQEELYVRFAFKAADDSALRSG
jgi:hypothetical protein